MRRPILSLFVVLAMLPTAMLFAQVPRVDVRLHEPPPGRLHLSDLWWLEINNATGAAVEISLEGFVREASRGEVYHGITHSFRLAAGRTRLTLPDIRIARQTHARGYEAFVLRTGSIPEGDYTYWVLVRGGATGGDTGRVRTTRPSPPRLVAPADGAKLTGPAVSFRWTAPMPPMRGVTYELKVAEVVGRQSKEEAMMTPRPWFVRSGLSATTFAYPRSARAFTPTRRYAWQVKAMAGGAVIAVSEVWDFVIGLRRRAAGPGTEIYFCDAGETRGSVYHKPAMGPESKVYTRPSNRIYSFLFAPWDAEQLLFVNANEHHIYLKKLGPGAPPESIIHTHTTYVRDIAIPEDGLVYFSEATGAGGDGTIYRLERDGSVTPFYAVRLSRVDGFWGGDFTFDEDGVLYLSTGNRVGAKIYRVDIAGDAVTPVFEAPGETIEGMSFGRDGLLYYADWHTKVYAVDLESATRDQVYGNGSRKWLSDVGFKPFDPGIVPPGGVTTWVMPYGVGGTALYRIDSLGLTSYGSVDSAPFGGRLGFRSGSSIAIPTADLHYYRWQYRAEGGTWQDFDEEVRVHYVKEVLGFLPTFPTLRLGPDNVGGKNLYQFRPHTPPTIPGATTYWPTSGFLGDIYSGFLNTSGKHLALGKYDIRLSVYDSSGNPKPHGGAFRFVVPSSEDGDGTIHTRLPKPGEIDAGGFTFKLQVDNRPCSAYVEAPTIGGTAASDTCGFLRYDPDDPSPVHIGYHASHPDGFAWFRFRIVRGIFTVDSSYVEQPHVFGTSAGVYTGDGAGNFEHDFLRSTLLGACTEAALSENLYVFAKATQGWGHRISAYDASFVRAFALAEEKE